jgi:hypothetical protein
MLTMTFILNSAPPCKYKKMYSREKWKFIMLQYFKCFNMGCKTKLAKLLKRNVCCMHALGSCLQITIYCCSTFLKKWLIIYQCGKMLWGLSLSFKARNVIRRLTIWLKNKQKSFQIYSETFLKNKKWHSLKIYEISIINKKI